MSALIRKPDLTRDAFDEHGFYKLGDALAFADPSDPGKGLVFAGRIAEDFKLSSGTWVHVGRLRATLLARFGHYATDVVIAGLNCDDIRILIVPAVNNCRSLCPNLPAGATAEAVLAHAAVRDFFAQAIAADDRGSACRVAAAMLLTVPPSFESGEMTDKGSINQHALLKNRSALLARLYADQLSADIILPARTA